jgi:phage terminase large subunit-like protein
MRAQEFDGEFANEGGKIGSSIWFVGGKDPDIDGKNGEEHPRRILDIAPEKTLKKVRFWDLAATEKKMVGIGAKKDQNDPDETVGTLVSAFKYKFLKADKEMEETNWCIEHQIGGFWNWDNLLVAIANTARHDGPYVIVVIEEEPGSGGKNQVAAIQTYFKQFPELKSVKVVGQRARDVGDRVAAANHWFGLAADGKMWMVKGSWNQKCLAQIDGFTQIPHDDRCTSITGAMTYIRPFKSWTKVPFVSL